MQPVNLFDLAAQQAHWLAVRQSAVAGNVANVNTPGYQALDVQPFSAVLGDTSVRMSATEQGHFTTGATTDDVSLRQDDDQAGMVASGNGVNLEDQLMKAADIRDGFSLNTAIVKAFYGMMATATKE